MVDRAPVDAAALVHCPFCQVIMANDGALAGQLARCPTCRNHFVMPGMAPVAQFVPLDSPARVTQPVQQPLPAAMAPVGEIATGAVLTGTAAPTTGSAPFVPVVSPVAGPAAEQPAVGAKLTRTIAATSAPVSVAPPAVQAVAAAAGLPIIDFAPGFHPEPKPTAQPKPAAQPAPVAAPRVAPGSQPAAQTAAQGAAPAAAVAAVPVVTPAARPVAPPLPSSPAAVAPGFGKLGFHPGPVAAPAMGATPAALASALPSSPPADAPPDPAALAAVHDTPETPPAVVHRVVQAAPAWMVSAVIHAVLVILLGMWVIVTQPEIIPLLVDVNWSKEKGEQLERTVDLKVDQPEPVDPTLTQSDVTIPVDEPQANLPLITPSVEGPAMALSVKDPGSMGGRGEGERAKRVAEFGGNEQSEMAVALGLKWIKEHQNTDGSWSFRHATCPKCNGKCRHNGVIGSPTGATAIALLPFLGAGQSHREGRYQESVRRGLYYLVNQMKKSTPRGRTGAAGAEGDLMGPGGNMYCHGLASIALCEAYGMTQDGGLRDAAQKSLDFIVAAQDKDGGGWRYYPGDRGDTSVVGWQLMALKSGHMAYLKVPPNTINKAIGFLDSVQADGGAVYGYTSPGQGGSTTAIGLLCRMYLGWKKDNPALQRGVTALGDTGPDDNDMYYNYYATQVLHHYGGDEWKKWNTKMRDHLIKTQSKTGHEEGSWWSAHPWNATGGRLYQTALSVMTLEVYYRHLPIYRDESVTREFGNK